MSRLAVVILLSSAAALAEGHPRVELALDPCIEARDEIRRIVQVELGDLLVEEVDLSRARTRASVGCEGSAIVLRVDDPASGQSLTRSLDVASAAPVVRARLIGLALVELVSSSWSELRPAAPAGPAAPLPVSPREAPPPVAPTLAHARITATGGVIRFSGVHALSGGELRVSDSSPGRLGLSVAAGLHRGSQPVDLGAIRTQVLDLGAAAQLHRAWRGARGEVGSGLRGGVVQMAGQTVNTMWVSSAFSARWFGAFAYGHVGVAIAGNVTLDAVVEAGYVLSPVTALVDGHRAVAVDGGWLAGHLGIGVKL
jgi:hypothetical protein